MIEKMSSGCALQAEKKIKKKDRVLSKRKTECKLTEVKRIY